MSESAMIRGPITRALNVNIYEISRISDSVMITRTLSDHLALSIVKKVGLVLILLM